MSNPVKSESAASKPAAEAASNAQSLSDVTAIEASFASLTDKLDYLSPEDVISVRLAYEFANEAHRGQLRNSGDPYITHPIAVAAQCAEWKLDTQALMAALLHDAMEDCGVTKAELAERFGPSVAELVDGLTKLEKLHFNTREENQSESFRKMLLAMARDVRVILIKLADRTHNMRTLSDAPREKRPRIASETLDIYAPIAYRLGLNQTYRELQDLSFKYLNPWRHSILSKAVAKARGRRRDLVHRVQADLDATFKGHPTAVRIVGREKTIYSIYKKMDEKNLSFAQVTDIYGFRIIVPQLIDCYTVLGLLHQLYKPVPGKFKDHIAISKINGYQSLHTTLVGPSGIHVEFQLRTEVMHLVAETGVAAHWLYKEVAHGDGRQNDRMGSQWLQSLLDIQDENRDATEFWEHVKVDLFPDAVYVFTPRSQIMAMPRGATIIDFAYAIHSSVGDHTVSAKVNGDLVSLRTEVKNGDVIEVITAPEASPNPAWLGFVKTARARSKIRQHLKTLDQTASENMGEKMLAQALRAEGIENVPDNSQQNVAVWDNLLRFSGNKTHSELMTDIGLGKRIASIVAKRLAKLLSDTGKKPDALLLTRERFVTDESISQGSVSIDGSESTSVRFGDCCKPIPGDSIVGYLGRGEGLTIHSSDCLVAKKLHLKDSERFIGVEWADEPVRAFETGIVVTVSNGKGVLASVANALASGGADIAHIDMANDATHGVLDLRFIIAVRHLNELEAIFKNLRRTTTVLKVQRAKDTSPITG